MLLCVVFKPMVGMAGEMHLAKHDVASHEATVASVGTQATLNDTPDEEQHPRGWHALLHADLCCGNAAILAYFIVPKAVPGVTMPSGLTVSNTTPDLHVDLFRPPILG